MHARTMLLAGFQRSLAPAAAPAFAQEAGAADSDSNIIIVTATKRNANLQDIPFSINAQTAEDIQKIGRRDTRRFVAHNVAACRSRTSAPARARCRCAACPAGQVVRDQPGVRNRSASISTKALFRCRCSPRHPL